MLPSNIDPLLFAITVIITIGLVLLLRHILSNLFFKTLYKKQFFQMDRKIHELKTKMKEQQKDIFRGS